MTEPTRPRMARLLDALTHTGPGYDLTPATEHPMSEHRVPLDDLTSNQLDQLYDGRDRYRLAWQSARARVKRTKRNGDSHLRHANTMWSNALGDLHRYRQAWQSARHRAAMYLQSNQNFAASLDNGHAVQLHAERVARSAASSAVVALTHQLAAEERAEEAEAALARAEDVAGRWEKYGSTDLRNAARILRTEVLAPAQPAQTAEKAAGHESADSL